MDKVLSSLQRAYPHLTFTAADSFYWSPSSQVVHYRSDAVNDLVGHWSLLHEVGHALLEHQTFENDFELLRLEVEAWEKARLIAQKFGFSITDDHIQDCLDTYREWLYLRSTCPFCTSAGHQITAHHYSCFNCNNSWQVSRSRLCRSYRKKVLSHKKIPS